VFRHPSSGSQWHLPPETATEVPGTAPGGVGLILMDGLVCVHNPTIAAQQANFYQTKGDLISVELYKVSL